ncbi:MAG: LysR family transcriptional regulator [Pseudomonadota bacterium]
MTEQNASVDIKPGSHELSLQPVLSALPSFEAAARAKSFTKAAHQISLSQQSVSRFVSNLEEYLGVQLFVRKHNKIQLTDEGEKLYRYTNKSLKSLHYAINEMKTCSSLTIHCTHGFSFFWMLPRQRKIQSVFPDMDIGVVSCDKTTGDDVLPIEGRVIRVNLKDTRYAPNNSHLLFREEVFPVCSPILANRLKIDKRKLIPHDLTKLPLLNEKSKEAVGLDWKKWFEFHGINIPKQPPPVIYNHINNINDAIAGRGITLAWSGLVDNFLDNGTLIELYGMRATSDNAFYLNVPPDSEFLTDFAETFIEELA